MSVAGIAFTRNKHIARRHYFVRERVEMLELRVPFVRSELNMADFFTKPLAAPAFFRFRNFIMNVPCVMLDGQSSTRGCENP